MAKDVLSIGLFTDAHVAGGDYSSRYCTHSLEKLAAATQTFIDQDVDAIVNLGDLLDQVDGDPTDPAESLAAAADIIRRFDGPYHFVLGNHDLDCMSKPDLLARASAAGTAARYAFEAGRFRFIVLDTNCFEDGSDYTPETMPEDWGEAWLGEAQLAWLADELARAGETPTIVLTHAELDHRITKSGENKHAVKDSAAARRIIAEAGNVVAVLQGHCHAGRFAEYDGIPYLTLQAMCEGPFPEQNAFAILHLSPDAPFRLEGFADQPSFS